MFRRMSAKEWLLFAIAAVLAIPFFHHVDLGGDSYTLARGSLHFWRALSEGRFPLGSDTGEYAPLQYLLSIPLAALGITQGAIVRLLAIFNMIFAFFTATVVRRSMLKAKNESGWLVFLGCILTGMPIWYARSSYGESLASCVLLLLLIESTERRRIGLLLLGSYLASLSKETAAPFVLLAATAGILLKQQRILLREAVALFSGAAAAVASTLAFNFLRFGTYINLNYTQEYFRVKDPELIAQFFLGQFVSPTAGLLFVWPTWFAAMLTLFALSKNRLRFLPVAAIVLGCAFGFANWYSPMGWTAWGPRLLFPWLTPALFLILVIHREEAAKLLRAIRKTATRRWTLLAFTTLTCFASFSVLFDNQLIAVIFKANETCPHIPVIQQDPSYYFKCIPYYLWRPTPLWINAWRLDERPLPSLYAALTWALIVAWALRKPGPSAT